MKRIVLSLRLKSSIEFADLISSGKLFQSSGAATEKARDQKIKGMTDDCDLNILYWSTWE